MAPFYEKRDKDFFYRDDRGGKTKLISFFVGQVMREMRGKANPAVVNEALAKFLG